MPQVDQQRVERWARIVANFESSGLSITEFCRREKLSIHQLQYWRRRLGRTTNCPPNASVQKRNPSSEVCPAQDTSGVGGADSPMIQIRVGSHAAVLVPAHMLDTVQAVLEMAVKLNQASQQQSTNGFHSVFLRK